MSVHSGLFTLNSIHICNNSFTRERKRGRERETGKETCRRAIENRCRILRMEQNDGTEEGERGRKERERERRAL